MDFCYAFRLYKRPYSDVAMTAQKPYCETFVHSNGSSALSEHQLDSRHHIDWDSTHIIDWETEYFPRKAREAIRIRRQRPGMNRDGGLELPHVYNRVLIVAPLSYRDANSQCEEVHWTEWTKEIRRNKCLWRINSLVFFVFFFFFFFLVFYCVLFLLFVLKHLFI